MTMSRELMGKIVDEVFDGAIEDASVIEQIYEAIKKHDTPSPSTHTVTPIDRLEEIAKAQKAYHDLKQQEFPTLDDFLDDDGELHLPADIGPLLSQSSYNGRYSEADWWLSTIQKVKAEACTAPPENHLPVDAPIVFGLEAQGHIPAVEAALSEGADWQEIGRRIGWDGETAKQYYERHLARQATTEGQPDGR